VASYRWHPHYCTLPEATLTDNVIASVHYQQAALATAQRWVFYLPLLIGAFYRIAYLTCHPSSRNILGHFIL
jgi:hypothetical protein